ncbi:uroporphyrinogen decarboxylase family protein [Chloroflexota bacterium]
MTQETEEQFSEKEKRLRDEIERKYGKTPEQLYEEREKRVRDAIQLKEPDRVPVSLRMVYLPARYTGIPTSTAYYDPVAWREAVIKTIVDFEPDIYQASSGMSAGPVLDILAPTQTQWPGGPLPPNVSHQAIDVECMKDDEYDLFLDDPTDFTLRYLLPRAFEAMAPLTDLPPLSERIMGFGALTSIFVRQDYREMGRMLLKAGEEQEKWSQAVGSLEDDTARLGFPPQSHMGGVGGAPFDSISDFYRGMRGAMMDMFRCPDKLIAACEKILDSRIKRATPADPNKRGNPKRLFLALHRGAEGFMSNKQFEKFYWPGLKKAMLTSIDLGYVPMPFCEGAYGDRLEYFLEMPKGKTVTHFDLTDMFKAKEILKDHVCIMGNVPSTLLQVGSPQDVEEYCRKLIEVCGKGGGLILTNGSSIDEAKPENLKAMINSAKKYSP